MSYKTDIELKAQVDAVIEVNGNRAITPPLHNSIETNIIDSKVNKSGGNVLLALTGYTTELTPSDNKHLTPKKYVDDLDALVVHLAGDEEIEGVKTFLDQLTVANNLRVTGLKGFQIGDHDGLGNYQRIQYDGATFLFLTEANAAATCNYKSLALTNSYPTVPDGFSLYVEDNIECDGVVTLNGLSASTVPYLDASNNLVSSAVTPTELGYLSGVTSAIQTQLNARATTAGTLAQFAATTSLELKTLISDETGSGALVFATSPTLVTPVLGVATATSVNGISFTSSTTVSTAGQSITTNGTTRVTLFGTTIVGGASDTTIFGQNAKSGTASTKVTLFGSNLNTAGAAANATYLFGTDMTVTAGSLIGIGKTINLQATGIVAMLPNSGNVTYTITGAGSVVIGDLISLGTSIGNATIIGKSASSLDNQTNGTVIGNGAKFFLDATYGAAGSGGVAVGEFAFSGAWRGTAVGSYTQALAVSSSAFGYGAYVNAGHGSVYGRGGYNSIGASTVFYNGNSGFDFYFGGQGSTWTNPAMPGSETPDLSAGLTAGTTITKLIGIPGKDYKPTPTLTNIRGGHIRVVGGPSTGTALGGEVQFTTTPASGVSSNNLNTEVVCASFDAVATGGAEETRFMLLDLTDGTLKRVSFGADDSGGTGFKYLRVAN